MPSDSNWKSRLATAEEGVRFLVVVGDVVGIDVDAAELFDKRDAFLLDGQGLEPEEVHFEEANGFNEVTVVLRAE